MTGSLIRGLFFAVFAGKGAERQLSFGKGRVILVRTTKTSERDALAGNRS